MNVSLTPKQKKFIEKQVKSGDYQTASEVVRDALRLLEKRDRQFERLRRDIQDGIDQLDRGEGIPFDEAAVRRIKAEGRRRLAASPRKRRA